MFYGQNDPRRAYIGKRGYYYIEDGPRHAGRYVCLNCTAYFRRHVNKTQVGRGTHEGWMMALYCPVWGAELTLLVKPYDPSEQMALGVADEGCDEE